MIKLLYLYDSEGELSITNCPISKLNRLKDREGEVRGYSSMIGADWIHICHIYNTDSRISNSCIAMLLRESGLTEETLPKLEHKADIIEFYVNVNSSFNYNYIDYDDENSSNK